ncbi:MAG: MBL fold metallo-hydrolase [Candidatus Liptonbacteria bacterium]|nr:MBL fold metallo-hydrolase [Candidatus Liptonbacteria bacterium]
MVITHHGEGSFRLQNGDFSILVDPPSNQFKANIVLKTLTPTGPLEVSPQEIVFPGEYEISGVEVLGVPLDSESTDKFLKTIYLVSWDEVELAFLGHISKIPSSEILDKIGEPDLLFLPVGEHFLSHEAAAKLVRQIEPALAIPTFSKNPGEFLKALSQKAEPQEKFVFKKKDLVGLKNRVLTFKT